MSIKRMKITDGILDIRMFLLLCRNKLDYSMYASRLEVANQQQKTSPKAQKTMHSQKLLFVIMLGDYTLTCG